MINIRKPYVRIGVVGIKFNSPLEMLDGIFESLEAALVPLAPACEVLLLCLRNVGRFLRELLRLGGGQAALEFRGQLARNLVLQVCLLYTS